MDEKASDVLNQITTKSSNDLIYFFIIVAVVAIIISIPLFTIISKDRKEKRKQENENAAIQARREDQYIAVIQHNTEVNSQLKTMLEINNMNCVECKYEHQEKMESLDEKLDSNTDKILDNINIHNNKLVEVATLLRRALPTEFGAEIACHQERDD